MSACDCCGRWHELAVKAFLCVCQNCVRKVLLLQAWMACTFRADLSSLPVFVLQFCRGYHAVLPGHGFAPPLRGHDVIVITGKCSVGLPDHNLGSLQLRSLPVVCRAGSWLLCAALLFKYELDHCTAFGPCSTCHMTVTSFAGVVLQVCQAIAWVACIWGCCWLVGHRSGC